MLRARWCALIIFALDSAAGQTCACDASAAVADSTFTKRLVVTNEAKGARCAVAADFDGDGLNDIVSASSTDNTVAWYRNLGNGEWSGKQDITCKPTLHLHHSSQPSRVSLRSSQSTLVPAHAASVQICPTARGSSRLVTSTPMATTTSSRPHTTMIRSVGLRTIWTRVARRGDSRRPTSLRPALSTRRAYTPPTST